MLGESSQVQPFLAQSSLQPVTTTGMISIFLAIHSFQSRPRSNDLLFARQFYRNAEQVQQVVALD